MTDTRELIERVVQSICIDVSELPDRSSPDDWPDACLVTAEELSDICHMHLTAAIEARSVGEVERLRDLLNDALPFIGLASTRAQVLLGVDAIELYAKMEAALRTKDGVGVSDCE